MNEISTESGLWKDLSKGSRKVVIDGSKNLLSKVSPIIVPILSLRPTEMMRDTVEYSLPYVSQTNACINFIKRKIRTSVMNKDKDSGVLNFSVQPKDSWLLDMSRVDRLQVVDTLNTWLGKMCLESDRYPKYVAWVEPHLLKSKVDYGNHFIVHYWWSPTSRLTLNSNED